MMFVFKTVVAMCISVPLCYALNIKGVMSYAFCFGVGALVAFIPNNGANK